MEETWRRVCTTLQRIAWLYSDGELIAGDIARHQLTVSSPDIRKFCDREVRQLLKSAARLYESAAKLPIGEHDAAQNGLQAAQAVEAEVMTAVENLRSFRALLYVSGWTPVELPSDGPPAAAHRATECYATMPRALKQLASR
jgi:hypothetical protein